MIIHCPFCGARSATEFDFRVTEPHASPGTVEGLYFRREHPEHSIEHWQHVRGCRLWLVVRRDLATAVVLGVAPLVAGPGARP